MVGGECGMCVVCAVWWVVCVCCVVNGGECGVGCGERGVFGE